MRIEHFGDEFWRNEEGELHRLDGPAIIKTDGSSYWYQNGRIHREDGPAARLSDGYCAWYIDGKRHRIDGPAQIFASGDQEWWINGTNISYEVWVWLNECNVDPDHTEWTDKEKMWFKLRFDGISL